MRIALDASQLLNIETGGARYTRQLINSLLTIDRVNEYLLLFFTATSAKKELFRAKHDIWKTMNNAEFRTINIPWFILDFFWEILPSLIPIENLCGKTNLVHSLGYRASFDRKIPVITTLFDLTLYKYPEQDPKRVPLFKSTIEKAVKRSSHIITISQNSKKDIIDILKVPEEKITVTYCGADAKFTKYAQKPSNSPVLTALGVPQPFVLYTGTMGANKNLKTLISAFKYLKIHYKVPHKLVLVGKKKKFILDHIANCSMQKDIIVTGYIDDDSLPFIYNAADLFVYVSKYEGFGLPVLEAMSCGLPVITSNVSSLPEVAGDAGILVEPDNTEQIAEAMNRVLNDTALRNTMSDKSLRKSKEFSWEKCARETLEVYKCLLKQY
ncbi:MAG: glycosyltransferase family 4 protein [Endomicrobiales bacterium]|nr:glycosyltransferase family 4 protein [Endomicrobiales bacterium]